MFYSKEWDVGPGDTASFPPKWMSADGKTLYLVFSGDDSFSVRQATLAVGEDRRSEMQLTRSEATVRVTCSQQPDWEIELNLQQGGIVTDFRLPAAGENLVTNAGNFSGMFNLFACSVRKGHPSAGKHGDVAKTLLKGRRPVDSFTVVREDRDEIALEVRGKTRGWRLLDAADEPILDYRQRYTFHPRSIA